MNTRTLAAAALLATMTGCAGFIEKAQTDCQAYGYQPGTHVYAHCVAYLSERRRQAAGQALYNMGRAPQ